MKQKLPENTIDLMNSMNVLEYFHNNFYDAMSLLKDNRDQFVKIFGKQNGVFRGEHLSKYWIINFKDKNFVIFTAKVRGTSYELVTDAPEEVDNEICIDFLKYVTDKLKNNDIIKEKHGRIL